MTFHVAKIIYWLMGWKIDRAKAHRLWAHKNVLVGFPHTTMKDTVLTMVGMHLLQKRSYTFIKKEAFFWPLSWFLKLNHAIPVTRSAPGGIVARVVTEFNRNKTFSVCIVPQGTRKSGSKLKTGFWHIAKKANASILCWYFDTANRHCVCVGSLRPTDSMEADLKAMQELYDKVGYVIPIAEPAKSQRLSRFS